MDMVSTDMQVEEYLNYWKKNVYVIFKLTDRAEYDGECKMIRVMDMVSIDWRVEQYARYN